MNTSVVRISFISSLLSSLKCDFLNMLNPFLKNVFFSKVYNKKKVMKNHSFNGKLYIKNQNNPIFLFYAILRPKKG